jgi:CheY-like chemotaxis protein
MKKTKVLVVEDDLLSMELVTDLLEVAGYEVLPAETAEEGIEIAIAGAPAIILMDIRLPGIDGLTATAILKDDPRTTHIPVVALTASTMRGDERKCLEAGCTGYIAKPINTRDLLRRWQVTLGPLSQWLRGLRPTSSPGRRMLHEPAETNLGRGR